MTADEKLARLEELAGEMQECTECRLHANRSMAVAGSGNPDARVVFVGEGPGGEEDIQGIPFVGPSGSVLDSLLRGADLTRDDAFTINLVGCRPTDVHGENRAPTRSEIDSCSRWFREQILIVDPLMLFLLGRVAIQLLLGPTKSVGGTVGQVHQAKILGKSGKMVTYPTITAYHPAAILRSGAWSQATRGSGGGAIDPRSDLGRTVMAFRRAVTLTAELGRYYYGEAPTYGKDDPVWMDLA